MSSDATVQSKQRRENGAEAFDDLRVEGLTIAADGFGLCDPSSWATVGVYSRSIRLSRMTALRAGGAQLRRTSKGRFPPHAPAPTTQSTSARGAGADRSGAGQARRRGGLVRRRGPPRPRRHPCDEGDLDAARADHAAAYAVGWDAEAGNAVLLFEAGDTDAALAALDRALAGRSWFHLQRRGYLLVNKARIAALGGRPEIAAALLAEIEASPARWPRPAIQALLDETRAALSPTRPGRGACSSSPVSSGRRLDYQAARVRLALARDHLRRHRARRRPVEDRPDRRAPPRGRGLAPASPRSGKDQRPADIAYGGSTLVGGTT